MIAASANQGLALDSCSVDRGKRRFASRSNKPAVLADVYQEHTNIAIWERELSATLKDSVEDVLTSNNGFETAMTVTPQCALSSISEALGTTTQSELSKNIAELVEMFCCLFELKRTGLRLAELNRAMCPRFHVDRVPCRLITTYQGVATEWLPHQVVDRSKLGLGSNGQSDLDSGLFRHQRDIQQLNCGDVALLKGELWEGNEKAGLVHRSPAVPTGESRLLLTLDVSS